MSAALRQLPLVRQRLAATAERPLLWGVYVCLALVLLTPLVVTHHTLYPFVVGKALYARTVIEVLVCLWTVLMLLRPAYRPPRSTLLLLLGAGLVAHALATIFGVSPTRSVWSTYQRMQGLVDAAHWFALVLVAVSVLCKIGQVRVLLNANLGVALAIGCLAAVGYFTLDVPLYNAPERDPPRIGSVLGNATYLGAYATTNFLVAAGFLARSFVGVGAQVEGGDVRGPVARWLARGFWAATALVCLFALVASGSFTALVALAAGLGVLVVAVVGLVRARVYKWLALGAGTLGGLGAAAVGIVFFFPAAAQSVGQATLEWPLLQRVAENNVHNPSFRKRRLAWSAGIDGFVERPWLGWGPENFVVVFGRHATGIGVKTEIHDYAHNKLIEEAATKGLLGLVCHFALWLFAFHAVWRAARGVSGRDRVFVLFVGAALVAYFVQQQALVDALPLSLQLVLLLVFVVRLETAAGGRGKPLWPWKAIARAGVPRLRLAVRPTLRRVALVACACAMTATAAAGIATNHAIYQATTHLQGLGPVRPVRERPLAHIEQALADFQPMANSARLRLYTAIATRWNALRVRRSAEAKRLLARAEQEGERAMAVEPENWHIRAALAKVYCVAGRTEPGYSVRSARERAKALALAPKLDSFLSWNLVTHERCHAAVAADSTE